MAVLPPRRRQVVANDSPIFHHKSLARVPWASAVGPCNSYEISKLSVPIAVDAVLAAQDVDKFYYVSRLFYYDIRVMCDETWQALAGERGSCGGQCFVTKQQAVCAMV